MGQYKKPDFDWNILSPNATQKINAALKTFNTNYPRFDKAVFYPLVISCFYPMIESCGYEWPDNEFPGVYIFADKAGNLLYIGSASNSFGKRL